MNIAFITAGVLPVPPVDGGAVENLIDLFLKENEKSGEHEITLYSIFSEDALRKSKEYKHTNFIFLKNTQIDIFKDKLIAKVNHYFNDIIFRPNPFLEKVMHEIKDKNYDRIIIENRPQYGYFIKNITNSPLVLHLHNDTLNSNVKNCEQILGAYNEVYTVSNYIRDRVLTIVNTKKVKTLYNGIDTESFSQSLTEAEYVKLRKKYNINKDDFVILYSGRIVKEKGVKELVAAFNNVSNRGNIKLLVLGSSIYGKTRKDRYFNEVENLVHDNKSNIIFTGYIDYKDIPKMYEIANIGVVPSIWDDPVTLTTVEMLSMKLPIIVTDSGGIPELVNEKCAITVKRNNEIIKSLQHNIEKLIDDKHLRNEMINCSRNHALKFTNKKYYQNFNKLIKGELGDEK